MSIIKKLKWDIFIAAAVLVCTLIAIITGSKAPDISSYDNAYVRLLVDGIIYGEYPLNADKEITVKSDYGENTVIIKDNTAYVKNATCRDLICVNEGAIKSKGQVIICVPNRLIISIEDGTDGEYDAIAY